MTTARAYRGAQTASHAIAELWRFAGSQFDAEVVEAFVAAWSAVSVPETLVDMERRREPSRALTPFREAS
jgi:HD-GYP domain-containing protein (c-di-GMP phosphodiesterase class II)